MLATTRSWRRLGIAVAAIVAGLPATALGAEIAGPKVVRIDPSTRAQTVLAGGDPWTSLAGIAVGSSGTIYVADRGGIYSLTAPGFAITPLATTSASGVVVSGSTLYAGGRDGVVRVGTDPPFTRTVLSPRRVGDVALVGSTLYSTSSPDCDAGRHAKVLAIDTVTGSGREVGDLGCLEHGAIAAAPDGTLLIARWDVTGPSTGIVRFNPVTGTVTPIATGGKLKAPAGIAVTASGDLIVADRTSGVLRISGLTGKQTTIASGGDVTLAGAVALDPSGNIYVTASGTAKLKATARRRQRFSAAGIRFSASCRPRCGLAYRLSYPDAIGAGSSYTIIDRVDTKRALRLKPAAATKRIIARALRRHRSLKVRLTLVPLDPDGQSNGNEVELTVVLVRKNA